MSTGEVGAAIYLLSPFTWYESALWGQNDQLGLIFLLAAFWSVTQKKWAWAAPIAMTISVLLKTNGFHFWTIVGVGGD